MLIDLFIYIYSNGKGGGGGDFIDTLYYTQYPNITKYGEIIMKCPTFCFGDILLLLAKRLTLTFVGKKAHVLRVPADSTLTREIQ